ncbi:MAG TPA: PTS sugar transporter subunit IIA [Candidatus Sulfomarinibacteraceae bacterium]|nr:PTS sugar transporter subunit IIA [Candidatus Sulfomarinibacteraceae bacterium]
MRDFRIVVAAHGDLAGALLSAAELICGRLEGVHAVGLLPTDSPESYEARFMAAAGDPAEPLLILSDLAGGTPHNVALAATGRLPRAVLISGVNLAVLIEAAMSTDALDGESVERLVASGREALVNASQLLATRRP